MSPALRTQFSDYAAFHRTSGNQACHYLGIPLIVFSLLSLLAQVPLLALGGFGVTLAELLIAGAFLYYVSLDALLAVLMLLVTAAMAAAGRGVGPLPALALFLLGWALQFLGHYAYEKKSPAFYRNLVHLLVGPLWILAKALGRA
jgi:uncharacterized membrane protein YGL010W